MLVGIIHPSVPVRYWIKAESKLLFFVLLRIMVQFALILPTFELIIANSKKELLHFFEKIIFILITVREIYK